jgi:uncharacterized membrane protein
VLALALGPFQFLPRLRARRPALHRWMGRLYLIAILLGGTGGLYMATMAWGGIPARLGFGVLALLWLGSGFLAYRSIRAGHVAVHRQWMIRNYALTFAAVTLRLQLPLSGLLGLDFTTSYAVIAWTCWLPNLLFAEWLIRRRRPAGRQQKQRLAAEQVTS